MLSESAERAGTSIWRPSLPPVEQESLGYGRNEEVVDLAVIGGGFTGLSAAYHALTAHPGMRVVRCSLADDDRGAVAPRPVHHHRMADDPTDRIHLAAVTRGVLAGDAVQSAKPFASREPQLFDDRMGHDSRLLAPKATPSAARRTRR